VGRPAATEEIQAASAVSFSTDHVPLVMSTALPQAVSNILATHGDSVGVSPAWRVSAERRHADRYVTMMCFGVRMREEVNMRESVMECCRRVGVFIHLMRQIHIP
jgi:hypothetical protein